MINSKDEALSSLPKVPIELQDTVYPARVILNSIIANQSYLLKNTNDVETNKTLDEHDNWNTLEPQTTFQFNGLGTGAPDKNKLATDQGIVTTVGSNAETSPMLMQIVITTKGIAYRMIGHYWSYLGHEVPNNVDADHLIDRKKLNDTLKKELSNYVPNIAYNQDSRAVNESLNKNADKITSLSDTFSDESSSVSNSFSSLDTQNSSQLSSINTQLDTNSENINDTYDSISANQSNISSMNDSLNGIQNADGSYYGGVYGSYGISEEVSNNTDRLDSSDDSMTSMSASLSNTFYTTNSATTSLDTQTSAIKDRIDDMIVTSQAEDLPDSTAYNYSAITSLQSSLAPIAMENMQELNSIATTTFTNSYAEINVISEEALSVSSTPSNFAPIISNVFVKSGIPYEFKANVAIKSENTSTQDNIPIYSDVTGTIGFEAPNENGINYQLLNNTSDDIPVPPADFQGVSNHTFNQQSLNNKLSQATSNKYVQINYPYTNIDIDTQLNNHVVDIIFVPTANEKLNIVAVPAKTDLEPSTYNNVQLTEHEPITQKSNTNSLLSATVTSVADLSNQYQQETSINNSNIVLNNQIANNALSGASQATSYLASAPRISLAPTYSYANSCSNQDPSHVFLYPQYDNDKEEKAIDWCLTNITPTNVKVYGNWAANTPTKDLINQVKNLTAGIIGNIEAVEEMMGGAVADPQNPDTVQDWNETNYLNWTLTPAYDTSSILNYLNSTLQKTPAQEWDGWEAYLGLHARADICAEWLSSQLKNSAWNAGYYAMNVRSLLY